jgi:hypothetical protein
LSKLSSSRFASWLMAEASISMVRMAAFLIEAFNSKGSKLEVLMSKDDFQNWLSF